MLNVEKDLHNLTQYIEEVSHEQQEILPYNLYFQCNVTARCITNPFCCRKNSKNGGPRMRRSKLWLIFRRLWALPLIERIRFVLPGTSNPQKIRKE